MSIELEHSFDVPVPPDRAWEVLLDVQRVAPCMPGATIDGVAGDEVTGRIKVKVGPIALTYTGKARFTELDEAARVVTMEASGKETRGAGTASARMHARMEERDGQTRVTVRTTLNVTGRPAQFGRGVMSEVAGRLVERFSVNLAEQLAAGKRPGPGPVLPNGPGSDSRLAMPIGELNLATRSFNSLRNEGIQTVGELVARTESELLGIKNLGEKSVGEIEDRLGEIGLALRGQAIAGGPGAEAAAGGGTPAGAAGPAAPARAADQSAAGQPAGGQTGIPGNGAVVADSSAKSNGAGPGQQATAGSDTAAPGTAAPGTAVPRGEPQDDALDLLDMAAVPVLKRALPALAAVIALVWLGTRLRRRARHPRP